MSKKGAHKTGGTAGRKRERDSSMAARLKAEGVKRTTFRCPVCNSMIPLAAADNHFRTHS